MLIEMFLIYNNNIQIPVYIGMNIFINKYLKHELSLIMIITIIQIKLSSSKFHTTQKQ